MSKTKLGFSTGKGFLEKVDKAAQSDNATNVNNLELKMTNGVLTCGEYKIPIHKTILNTAEYYGVGDTICTLTDWQEGVTLLEITYTVDANHSHISTKQMKGSKCYLSDADNGVYVYVSNGTDLVWGETAGSDTDAVIYRIDKVIV